MLEDLEPCCEGGMSRRIAARAHGVAFDARGPMAICCQRSGKSFEFPHQQIMDLSFLSQIHSSHLGLWCLCPPLHATCDNTGLFFSPYCKFTSKQWMQRS